MMVNDGHMMANDGKSSLVNDGKWWLMFDKSLDTTMNIDKRDGIFSYQLICTKITHMGQQN